MSEIAIDIETISPHLSDSGDVDFLNSRDFELLCVGVGYRASPGSTVETDVLWRRGLGPEGEGEVLAKLCDYLAERHYDTILTFNGAQFDFRHLRGRASITAEEVGDHSVTHTLHRRLEEARHRDLMHDIQRAHGRRMTLEDAVEEYTGDRPPTVSWDGETISNGDIPRLGQRLLSERAGLGDMPEDRRIHLRDVLETYVEADIRPLFQLHDALCD